MKPIIEIRNISKKYQIRESMPYYSLRDSIAHIWQHKESSNDKFWALKNISFDVKNGECIGIIGPNGAGKSTLLKILSRVTNPTKGEAILRGRMASLLEVGTGFHPELTGRENILLYGAILGMKKREIEERFDEIIKFAEISSFLETPIKHYSSGMYTRLAFSVAAHMRPEILVIDEVLAVGDAAFQRKCVAKMEELSRSGCTILFVSHNMSLITNLCKRSVLLEKGKVVDIGPTNEIVAKYLKTASKSFELLSKRRDRIGDGKIRLKGISAINSLGESVIKSFDNVKIALDFDVFGSFTNLEIKMAVLDASSRVLFRIDSDILPSSILKENKKIIFETEQLNLAPTMCIINVGLFADGVLSDYLKNAYAFDIIAGSKNQVKVYNSDMTTILIKHKLLKNV